MGHKILLVEDDPCFGSVLKSYLELSDYDVIHCTMALKHFVRKSSICVYWM